VQHALAIDLGTGGPKVALVASDGRIAYQKAGRTRLLLGPDGAAEQDPAEWWTSITGAVRRLLARGQRPPDRDALPAPVDLGAVRVRSRKVLHGLIKRVRAGRIAETEFSNGTRAYCSAAVMA
jgi:hypothetical protein